MPTYTIVGSVTSSDINFYPEVLGFDTVIVRTKLSNIEVDAVATPRLDPRIFYTFEILDAGVTGPAGPAGPAGDLVPALTRTVRGGAVLYPNDELARGRFYRVRVTPKFLPPGQTIVVGTPVTSDVFSLPTRPADPTKKQVSIVYESDIVNEPVSTQYDGSRFVKKRGIVEASGVGYTADTNPYPVYSGSVAAASGSTGAIGSLGPGFTSDHSQFYTAASSEYKPFPINTVVKLPGSWTETAAAVNNRGTEFGVPTEQRYDGSQIVFDLGEAFKIDWSNPTISNRTPFTVITLLQSIGDEHGLLGYGMSLLNETDFLESVYGATKNNLTNGVGIASTWVQFITMLSGNQDNIQKPLPEKKNETQKSTFLQVTSFDSTSGFLKAWGFHPNTNRDTKTPYQFVLEAAPRWQFDARLIALCYANKGSSRAIRLDMKELHIMQNRVFSDAEARAVAEHFLGTKYNTDLTISGPGGVADDFDDMLMTVNPTTVPSIQAGSATHDEWTTQGAPGAVGPQEISSYSVIATATSFPEDSKPLFEITGISPNVETRIPIDIAGYMLPSNTAIIGALFPIQAVAKYGAYELHSQPVYRKLRSSIDYGRRLSSVGSVILNNPGAATPTPNVVLRGYGPPSTWQGSSLITNIKTKKVDYDTATEVDGYDGPFEGDTTKFQFSGSSTLIKRPAFSGGVNDLTGVTGCYTINMTVNFPAIVGYVNSGSRVYNYSMGDGVNDVHLELTRIGAKEVEFMMNLNPLVEPKYSLKYANGTPVPGFQNIRPVFTKVEDPKDLYVVYPLAIYAFMVEGLDPETTYFIRMSYGFYNNDTNGYVDMKFTTTAKERPRPTITPNIPEAPTEITVEWVGSTADTYDALVMKTTGNYADPANCVLPVITEPTPGTFRFTTSVEDDNIFKIGVRSCKNGLPAEDCRSILDVAEIPFYGRYDAFSNFAAQYEAESSRFLFTWDNHVPDATIAITRSSNGSSQTLDSITNIIGDSVRVYSNHTVSVWDSDYDSFILTATINGRTFTRISSGTNIPALRTQVADAALNTSTTARVRIFPRGKAPTYNYTLIAREGGPLGAVVSGAAFTGYNNALSRAEQILTVTGLEPAKTYYLTYSYTKTSSGEYPVSIATLENEGGGVYVTTAQDAGGLDIALTAPSLPVGISQLDGVWADIPAPSTTPVIELRDSGIVSSTVWNKHGTSTNAITAATGAVTAGNETFGSANYNTLITTNNSQREIDFGQTFTQTNGFLIMFTIKDLLTTSGGTSRAFCITGTPIQANELLVGNLNYSYTSSGDYFSLSVNGMSPSVFAQRSSTLFGEPIVVSLRYNPSTTTFETWYNNTLAQSATGSFTYNFRYFTLGKSSGNGAPTAPCKFIDLVAYDGPLSDPDFEAARTAIYNRYHGTPTTYLAELRQGTTIVSTINDTAPLGAHSFTGLTPNTPYVLTVYPIVGGVTGEAGITGASTLAIPNVSGVALSQVAYPNGIEMLSATWNHNANYTYSAVLKLASSGAVVDTFVGATSSANFAGLPPNTEYILGVAHVYDGHTGDYVYDTQSTRPVPTVSASLTQQPLPQGAFGLDAAWTYDQAYTYLVKLHEGSSGGDVVDTFVGATSSTSFAGLSENTQYTLGVAVVYNGYTGDYSYSTPVSTLDLNVNSNPMLAQVALPAGIRSLNATWDASPDYSYQISLYAGTTAGAVVDTHSGPTGVSGTDSHVFAGLDPETTYWIGISPVYEGNAGDVEYASATTRAVPDTSGPPALSQAAYPEGIDSIQGTWNFEAAYTYDAILYEGTIAGSVAGTFSGAAGTTTFTDLLANTQYAMAVATIYEGFTGAYIASAPVSTRPVPLPTGQALSQLPLIEGIHTVSASWDTSAGYTYLVNLHEGSSGDAVVDTFVGATSATTFTGLTPNTTYTIGVAVLYSGETGEFVYASESTRAVPVATGLSLTPASGATGVTELNGTWSAVAGLTYLVLLRQGGETGEVGATFDDQTSGSITFSGLMADTVYTMEVVSKYGASTSASSTITNATTQIPIFGVELSGQTQTSIDVGLTGADFANFDYSLSYYKTSAGVGSATTYGSVPDASPITFSSLAPGANYTFIVSATVASGGSAREVSANTNTLAATVPSLSVALGSAVDTELDHYTRIDASWPAIPGYTLSLSIIPSPETVDVTGQTGHSFTNLPHATEYTLELSATLNGSVPTTSAQVISTATFVIAGATLTQGADRGSSPAENPETSLIAGFPVITGVSYTPVLKNAGDVVQTASSTDLVAGVIKYTSLVPGSAYTFELAASFNSDVVNATPIVTSTAAAIAPSGLTVSVPNNNTPTTVRVVFSPITNYTYDCSITAPSGITAASSGPGYFEFVGLTPEVEYTFSLTSTIAGDDFVSTLIYTVGMSVIPAEATVSSGITTLNFAVVREDNHSYTITLFPGATGEQTSAIPIGATGDVYVLFEGLEPNAVVPYEIVATFETVGVTTSDSTTTTDIPLITGYTLTDVTERSLAFGFDAIPDILVNTGSGATAYGHFEYITSISGPGGVLNSPAPIAGTTYAYSSLNPGVVYDVAIIGVYVPPSASGITAAAAFETTASTLAVEVPSASATGETESTVDLTWTVNADAQYTNYLVAVKDGLGELVFGTTGATGGAGDFGRAATGTAVGLMPGATYTAEVVAVYSTAYAGEEPVKTLSVPAIIAFATLPLEAPSASATGASSTTVDLSWNVNANTQYTNYLVAVKDGQGALVFGTTGATGGAGDFGRAATGTAVGLMPGATYTAEVVALFDSGYGEPILTTPDTLTFATLPLEAPSASATGETESTVDLSWNVNANTQYTNYLVAVKDGQGALVFGTTGATGGAGDFGRAATGTAVGLMPGATYTAEVVALFDSGYGEPILTTPDTLTFATLPLEAPSASATGETESTVDLSWNVNANTQYTNYLVAVKDGQGALVFGTTGATGGDGDFGRAATGTAVGLMPGATYTAEVVALFDSGYGEPILTTPDTLTFATLPLEAPVLSATGASEVSVDLMWTVNPDARYANYLVAVKDDLGALVFGTTGATGVSGDFGRDASATVSGLLPGATYTAEVAVLFTSDGDTVLSEADSLTFNTGLVVSPPITISNIGVSSFGVSWTPNAGPNADKYVYSYSVAGGQGYIDGPRDATPLATSVNMPPNTELTINLIARLVVDQSTTYISETPTVDTVTTAALTAAVPVLENATHKSLSIGWTADADARYAYDISSFNGGETGPSATDETPPALLSGLRPGTTYSVDLQTYYTVSGSRNMLGEAVGVTAEFATDPIPTLGVTGDITVVISALSTSANFTFTPDPEYTYSATVVDLSTGGGTPSVSYSNGVFSVSGMTGDHDYRLDVVSYPTAYPGSTGVSRIPFSTSDSNVVVPTMTASNITPISATISFPSNTTLFSYAVVGPTAAGFTTFGAITTAGGTSSFGLSNMLPGTTADVVLRVTNVSDPLDFQFATLRVAFPAIVDPVLTFSNTKDNKLQLTISEATYVSGYTYEYYIVGVNDQTGTRPTTTQRVYVYEGAPAGAQTVGLIGRVGTSRGVVRTTQLRTLAVNVNAPSSVSFGTLDAYTIGQLAPTTNPTNVQTINKTLFKFTPNPGVSFLGMSVYGASDALVTPLTGHGNISASERIYASSAFTGVAAANARVQISVTSNGQTRNQNIVPPTAYNTVRNIQQPVLTINASGIRTTTTTATIPFAWSKGVGKIYRVVNSPANTVLTTANTTTLTGLVPATAQTRAFAVEDVSLKKFFTTASPALAFSEPATAAFTTLSEGAPVFGKISEEKTSAGSVFKASITNVGTVPPSLYLYTLTTTEAPTTVNLGVSLVGGTPTPGNTGAILLPFTTIAGGVATSNVYVEPTLTAGQYLYVRLVWSKEGEVGLSNTISRKADVQEAVAAATTSSTESAKITTVISKTQSASGETLSVASARGRMSTLSGDFKIAAIDQTQLAALAADYKTKLGANFVDTTVTATAVETDTSYIITFTITPNTPPAGGTAVVIDATKLAEANTALIQATDVPAFQDLIVSALPEVDRGAINSESVTTILVEQQAVQIVIPVDPEPEPAVPVVSTQSTIEPWMYLAAFIVAIIAFVAFVLFKAARLT